MYTDTLIHDGLRRDMSNMQGGIQSDDMNS